WGSMPSFSRPASPGRSRSRSANGPKGGCTAGRTRPESSFHDDDSSTGVRWIARGKDAGRVRIRGIRAQRRTPPCAIQRSTAAQGFIVKRALNKVNWHWQAVAGVLALVAGVTLAVLAAGEATRPQAEPPMVTSSGLAATASLSRRVLLFGDPLTARFDIVVDRRRLNPDLVRLETSFVPFTPVAEGRSRRDNGSLTELRYIFTLDCNEAACLPSMARKRQFVLSPARVLYREPARGGSLPAEVAIQMPSVEIASRLSATEVRMIQRRNPLRVLDGPTIGLGIEDATLLIRDSSSELPPATYRVSPYLLVALLFALAALLTVGAAIVLLSRLRSERPPPPPPPEPEIAGSPLEHALGPLEP